MITDLSLGPLGVAGVQGEFRICQYDVPWYDEENKFHHTGQDWPVLFRASGNYADYGERIEISVHRHPIIRYTACGCWIATWSGKKFVNLKCEKQWASDSQDEAIRQLYFRKRKQIQHLERQTAEATEVHDVLVKHFGQKPPAPRPRTYRDYDDYGYY